MNFSESEWQEIRRISLAAASVVGAAKVVCRQVKEGKPSVASTDFLSEKISEYENHMEVL